jgi:hypothetical protein
MKTINLFFIFLIFLNFRAYAQTNEDLKLMDMGIYKIDSLAKTENSYLEKEWIKCNPLSVDDINNDFSNIQDLSWLQSISKEQKAIFIGENHFYKYIHTLRNRIIFALNTFDYYPVVIFEGPYPFSAFADYYLKLPDDKQADIVYEQELYNMITTKDEYDLLQHIRRWNKTHTDKFITVGYRDIERTMDELSTTLNQIVIPYFQIIDPQFKPDLKVLSKDFKQLILEFRKYLKKAHEINLVGKYPFITPQYVSTVIDDLESCNDAYYKNFKIYRQKAIIRNLSDAEFLGKYLANQKVIIHGGYAHLATHAPYAGKSEWEGDYLTHEFEPTKGKTYSIKIEGIARSLGKTANLDKPFIEPALGYKKHLQKMQAAFKNGLLKPDDYCFVNIYDQKLNDYYKLWIQKGIEYNLQGLLVESFLWDKIIDKVKEQEPEKANLFISAKNENNQFDKTIVIPCSPLIMPKIKKD